MSEHENEIIEIDREALLAEFYTEPEPPAVKVEIGDSNVRMLYSLVSSLTELSDRIVASDQRQTEIIKAMLALQEQMVADRENLVASLTQAQEPVINVTVPEPVVNVTVPDIVFPDMPAPVVHVQPPEVNITYTPPSTSKQIKVTRDPITGSISSAEVTDG